MNTGIVMIGLSLVLLSVGLMISPSAAAGPDTACSAVCGGALFQHDAGSAQPGPGAAGICEISPYPGITATDHLPAP